MPALTLHAIGQTFPVSQIQAQFIPPVACLKVNLVTVLHHTCSTRWVEKTHTVSNDSWGRGLALFPGSPPRPDKKSFVRARGESENEASRGLGTRLAEDWESGQQRTGNEASRGMGTRLAEDWERGQQRNGNEASRGLGIRPAEDWE